MTMHLTYGSKYSLDIEVNKEFGATPLFTTEQYKREVILNLPYIQIIFTPHNCPIGNEINENTKHERPNAYPAGTTQHQRGIPPAICHMPIGNMHGRRPKPDRVSR